MAKKDVKVTRESPTGRNERFETKPGREISRTEFVKEIKQGKHPGYHVANIHGKPTPRSNPDGSEGNNLD